MLYPDITVEDIHVILVHSGENLLPTLVPRLSAYCARVLDQRGVDLRLNTRVQSVTATQVHLNTGENISASTAICTVGNAPHPVVLDLIKANQLPELRGRLTVDSSLRVPGQPGLWAAGDCAAVPFVKGGLCPQTAQFAYREGRLLGRNLAAVLAGREPRPFTFRGLGELATIGHHAAVANIFGFNFSGRFAWFLWRTVYLSKLPRLDRKLRVVLDWTLDLFFPRDLAVLSPRYTQVVKEIHLEPGDALFRAGEPAYSLYVVRSGAVELSDESGVVSHHERGDYFGERALLTDRKWMFTARAIAPTQLVSIPAGVFRQLIGSGGSLGRLFERSAQRYQSREVIDALVRQLPEEVLEQSVDDIMRTDLVTLRRDQTVASALDAVRDHPHSSYPLVDEGGRYAGMVRREDFQDFLRRSPLKADARVEEVGLSTVPVVAPEAGMREVVERLVRTGANKLIVASDDGVLLGIVTVMDLAAASARVGSSSR